MREQTKDIGTYILDACEDLTFDDLCCLVDHTTGPLKEFFQKAANRQEIIEAERHYEDFSDRYRPDPQTGDMVYTPENDYAPGKW